jgi:hypothetical protein
MPQETGVAAIAHAIQLAVAPVFLLSGIGAILAVTTNRLSRVIDRARTLESRLLADPDERGLLRAELSVLARRAKLVSRAIALCTMTALLICATIAVLFASAFLDFDATRAIALLFVAAMLTFFVGLLYFLREIFLAIRQLRIGHP